MTVFYYSWISYPILALEYFLFASLFGLKNKKNQHYPIRVAFSCLLLVVIVVAAELILNATVGSPILYNLDSFIGAIGRGAFQLVIFIFAFFFLATSYDEELSNTFLCLVFGFSIQHLRSNLCGLVGSLAQNWSEDSRFVLLMIVTYSMILLLATGIYFASKYQPHLSIGKHPLLYSIIYGIAALICTVLTVFDSVISGESYVLPVIRVIYRLIPYVLLGFIILSNMRRTHLQNKANTMENILNKEIDQHRLSKEAQELINIRVHDLKHMLDDQAEKEALNDAINNSDTVIKTGNPVVDIVISHYAKICKDKGICFACILDGTLFDFMEKEEIYSFFGNLLSNAVEALDKVENPNQKNINLSAKKFSNMVFVHEENHFAGEVIQKKGNLLTTKTKNPDQHGYGTKSIQLLAEKYGGEMKCVTKDNVFYLDVIFGIDK